MSLNVLTPAQIEAAVQGVRADFLRHFAASDVGDAANLWRVLNSTNPGESYPQLGGSPGMEVFGGTITYTGVRKDAFMVTNEQYTAGLQIPQSAIEDDSLGSWDAEIAQMAENAAYWPMVLLGVLLANITSASIAKCWDGKAMIAADHGKGDGTYSNIISGSGVDTVDHVQTDIAKAVALSAQAKDDKGNYVMGNRPNFAIVPAENYGLHKILDTIIANRTSLGTPDQSGTLKGYMLSPYITGNDWYMASAGGARRPFLLQVRKQVTPYTHFDQDTLSIKQAIEWRGTMACMYPDCIWQIDN